MSNALDTQIRDLYIVDETEEINAKNLTYKSLFKLSSLIIK